MTSLGSLRPLGGQHAIQTAAVAFTWSAEVPAAELQHLRSRAATSSILKQAFPLIEDRQIVKFGFGVGVPNVKMEAPSIETGSFVLNGPAMGDGASPSRSVVVDMRQVLISINNYSRWKDLVDDLRSYLPTLLGSFSSKRSISAIGLQYVDAFEWEADRSELDLANVFRSDSPYLVPNAFRTAANWHCHHGLFNEVSEPIKYRRLDNINVSREDQDALHVLQILTSHQALLTGAPLWRWAEAKLDLTLAVLQQLHDENKRVLGELLTADVQKMINLNPTDGG